MAPHALGKPLQVFFAALYIVGSMFVIVLSASSPPAAITWNTDRVQVNQGDSISVSCSVPDFNLLSVVRLQRRDDEKQTRMVLADNGDVKAPFAGNRRYRVEFEQRGSVGHVTIHYTEIRGEDAGTLACFKLTQSDDENTVALLQLKVLVPVQSVRLMLISSDLIEQPVDDETNDISRSLTLTEVSLSNDDGQASGVVCVASVNGSLTPPSVRMLIDTRDVTGQFVVTEQSLIIEEAEAETQTGGGGRLGFYYGEKRLTYFTASPDATWNGRTLTCAASQEGFPDTFATTQVNIIYSPQITCPSRHVQVDQGDVAQVVCNIRASPPPEVTWFFVSKNETIGNATNNLKQLATVSRVDGSIDQYEASVQIAQTTALNLGDYRLVATNYIGASEETVSVRLWRNKPNVRENSANRPRGQPVTGEHSAPDSTSVAVCRMQPTTVTTLLLVVQMLVSVTRLRLSSIYIDSFCQSSE